MRIGLRAVSSDALLRRARQGDADALSQLLARHRQYLVQLARARMGQRLQSKADPADVIQETLLAAYRQFNRFRGGSNVQFAAWLRRILARRIANHLRHFLGTKQRDARLEQVLTVSISNNATSLEQQQAAPGASPVELAERRELSRTLIAALKSLPKHYREVVVLRHMEDLPYAAVAARMGRSVSSVEKLRLRALAHLRKTLGDDA